MAYLHTLPHIAEGLEELLARDPVFSNIDFDLSSFFWPHFEGGFSGLTRIVLGQQLSIKAAAAIWSRLLEMGDVCPERYLGYSEESLRGIGLSRQKVSYSRGLAEAMLCGSFAPGALENMNDADVMNAITALKGFGPWSAQMYLMFCLARPDIWPAGDLGIQNGLKLYLGSTERPGEKQALEHKQRFTPHCTAASLLLWGMKG